MISTKRVSGEIPIAQTNEDQFNWFPLFKELVLLKIFKYSGINLKKSLNNKTKFFIILVSTNS